MAPGSAGLPKGTPARHRYRPRSSGGRSAAPAACLEIGSVMTRLRSPKTACDPIGGEHLGRIARRVHPALGHVDQVVGVARGEVQVVQHHHDRGAAGAVEVGQQVEHLDLVGDVEEGRRLVEQQDVGLLGQRHRDPDPLPLPAGQLVDGPVGELGRPGHGQRLGDGRVVGSGPPRQHPLVRVPAPADQVADDDALGRDRRLRQQPERAGDLLGRQPVQVLAVEQDLAGRGVSSRDIARSSVDLPQALAPTIVVIRPGRQCEVERVDDDPVAVAEGGPGWRAERVRVGHSEPPARLVRTSR